MPLDVSPPRKSRFGSPLVLSRVHWVRPELVVEVPYLTWTATACFARSFTRGSERTSRHPRCDGRHRVRRKADLLRERSNQPHPQWERRIKKNSKPSCDPGKLSDSSIPPTRAA